MGLLTFQTAKELTHPQTISLPCRSQPKPPQTDACPSFLEGPIGGSHRGSYSLLNVCIIVWGAKDYIRLYGANTGAERVVFVVSKRQC